MGVAMCVAVREAAMWTCSCKAHSDAMYAAARGVMWPVQ